MSLKDLFKDHKKIIEGKMPPPPQFKVGDKVRIIPGSQESQYFNEEAVYVIFSIVKNDYKTGCGGSYCVKGYNYKAPFTSWTAAVELPEKVYAGVFVDEPIQIESLTLEGSPVEVKVKNGPYWLVALPDGQSKWVYKDQLDTA